NRNKSLLTSDSDSHVAGATFSSSLGRNWKFSLSESFALTSNLAAFNAARGVTTSAPDAFRFLFYPSAVNQSSQSNTAQIKIDYLTDNSTLSVDSSHALLSYSG